MRGAEIGEQLEILAQAQQPGFGALVVSDAVPFRAADRAEHHGVGVRARPMVASEIASPWAS